MLPHPKRPGRRQGKGCPAAARSHLPAVLPANQSLPPRCLPAPRRSGPPPGACRTALLLRRALPMARLGAQPPARRAAAPCPAAPPGGRGRPFLSVATATAAAAGVNPAPGLARPLAAPDGLGAGRGGRRRRARRAEAAKGLTRPAAPELNPPAAPRERPGEGGCRLPAPSGAAGWGMLALQKPSGGVFEISVLTTDGSYQEIRVREEDGKCKRSRRSDEASHHPAPSLPGSGRDLASLS